MIKVIEGMFLFLGSEEGYDYDYEYGEEGYIYEYELDLYVWLVLSLVIK